jgi:hypothetical protein
MKLYFRRHFCDIFTAASINVRERFLVLAFNATKKMPRR